LEYIPRPVFFFVFQQSAANDRNVNTPSAIDQRIIEDSTPGAPLLILPPDGCLRESDTSVNRASVVSWWASTRSTEAMHILF
jgi:hypothetical protein